MLRTENENFRLIKQVRKFADLNTNAILDPNCQLFTLKGIEGVIGYRIKDNCAVVLGDPLCAKEDQLIMAKAFKEHCKELNLNVVYAIISEAFARTAINNCGTVCIQFGNKVILDPFNSPVNKTGTKASLVRRKVRHAQKEGLITQEYLKKDMAIENAIEEVGQSWLNSRQGPQIHIANLSIFKNSEGKRWFYAKKGEKIVGFLILNEVQAENGWFLNNLIVTPDSPGGTSELLIISTLEILKQENCKRVIAGPLTTKEINNVMGLGIFSSWIMRQIFKVAKKIFYLDRQTIFWEKFHPKTESCYLLFDKVNIKAFKALFTAMNVEI